MDPMGFIIRAFLPRAENDLCASLSVSAVPLCKGYVYGMLLLNFDVCLGIMWDGYPPPPGGLTRVLRPLA